MVDREVEQKYSQKEIEEIFRKFSGSGFGMKESLLKYRSEGLVSE